ncbi:MAG: FtsQ-type POTRA domain-containing protein [Candidatus Yonathbacteria bacterium]|nr:FtsQ-type POTRA domain-containing protein [Candidatus Yonathbacteria bacterium]
MEKLSNTIAIIREQIGAGSSSMLIVFVLSFIFFVTGGGISHSAKWRIDRIEVAGAKSVPEDIVRRLVRQKLEGNYFFVYARENSRLFPKKEIEQMLLETFPRIDQVSVNRFDNHTLITSIIERTPYALWCGEWPDFKTQGIGTCWFIDENGFVFDSAPVFSPGVYMEVYGKLLEKNEREPLRGQLPYQRFTTINTFAEKVRKEFGEPARIALKEEGELELSVRFSSTHTFLNGVAIRFKDEYSPETVIKNLRAAISVQFPDNTALKKKLLYIDMRFGNKIFFGFEN